LPQQRLVHNRLVNRRGKDIIAQFHFADDFAFQISQRNQHLYPTPCQSGRRPILPRPS
jgi:hypothetical protein